MKVLKWLNNLHFEVRITNLDLPKIYFFKIYTCDKLAFNYLLDLKAEGQTYILILLRFIFKIRKSPYSECDR